MDKFLNYIPAALFFVFVIWMMVLADLDKTNLIIDVGHSVPAGDKIGHFILFGMLALLLNMALQFRQIDLRSRTFHLGSVLVFAFACLEEFSQLAFSTRTFDLIDMLFDLFGIGVLSSVAFRKFLVKKLRVFVNYLDKKLLKESESPKG